MTAPRARHEAASQEPDCFAVNDDVSGGTASHQDSRMLRLSVRFVRAGAGNRFRMLIAGNLLNVGERARTKLGRQLILDAREISTADLETLLLSGEWPERLTAAWLAAAARRIELRPLIAELLAANESYQASEGYCLALARFATAADSDLLEQHLDRFLSTTLETVPPVVWAAQGWALGALMYLDAILSTSRADKFVAPETRWAEWVEAARLGPLDPTGERQRIQRLCDFLEQARRYESKAWTW